MYGLWLFKEIGTEYGACMVEIYRKNYTGESIEIGALAANSLSIALENLGSITDPIGKTVCSFSIIDTDQVEYDDFFTPDATAYKVVVSSRVGSGAYVTRWSGYVTPDFFAENLSYRTPISISARDNIGYLNDVDFDLTASTITIRELITKAFARIAEDYPMSLSFVSQKQTAEGILAIDATISTLLLKEMSWGEALETILHDLGLQMRWVDNNTIAVMDLSQIPEYYATQGFNFIGASGYREILPAWRQLSQSQDYGLRENFFEGWMRSDNLTFIKSQTIQTPDEYYGHEVRYYTPNNWGVAREIYTTDPAFYNSSFGEKIIFSAVSKDNPSTTYMSWSADILTSNKPLTIKFKAMNSVLYPYGGIKPYPLQLRLYDPFLAFARTPGDYLQIGMRFNLFLHAKDNKTYVMREDWMEDNGTGGGEYLNFTLDKISLESYQSQEGSGSFPVGTRPSEKELTITANTIPYDGVLELRIYGYYVVDYKFGLENGTSVSHSPNFDKFFAYIDGVTYTFDNSDIPTGQDTAVQINELHNVKGSQDYIFGEVPLDHGGINAYAGGLFKADGTELYGFQRNAEGENYNLLELVGREAIHFNKKNYNKLSGQIKNLDKEPLMFNRLFIREGKTYMPFSASLNIISNEMNITTMQEVEPYETASFTEINSELVTGGGATIGGGNNTILQYSEDAGNAKRVHELQAATEAEKEDGYVLIDNAGFPEAKKVHISEITGLDKEALEQYLQSGYFTGYKANDALMLGGQKPEYYATYTALTDVSRRVTDLEKLFYYDEEHDAVRTSMSLIIDKWITFGGIGMGQGTVTGATELDGLNDVQITRPEGGQVLMYDEDLGLWVNKAGGGVSGDYLPLSGGTVSGDIKLALNPTSTSVNDTYAIGFQAPNTYYKYLHLKDGVLSFYEGAGEDYTLIHSGNIGSYNAGSATKLQTARTIWGQSFDGTSNVDGVITTMQVTASSVPVIKFSNGEHFDNWGNFCFGENSGAWSVRNSTSLTTQTYLQVVRATGNVLIGTTIDNGYKLDVNGGSLRVCSNVTTSSDTVAGFYTYATNPYGLQLRAHSTTGASYLQARREGKSEYYNLCLQPDGGNVLIGTTTDNGGRLQVAGYANIVSDNADGGLEITDNYISQWHRALTALSPNMKANENQSIYLGKANNSYNGAVISYQHIADGSRSNRIWFGLHSADYLAIIDGYGNFTVTGALTFNMASDRRLKDNIKPLTYRNTMRVLHRLKPVSFEWNEIAFSLDNTKEGICDGFLADEYEKLIPNSGRAIWEKYRAIDYTRAIPYLAKGWQIHESELDKMRKKVKIMERRIEHLENILVEHNIMIA